MRSSRLPLSSLCVEHSKPPRKKLGKRCVGGGNRRSETRNVCRVFISVTRQAAGCQRHNFANAPLLNYECLPFFFPPFPNTSAALARPRCADGLPFPFPLWPLPLPLPLPFA